MEIPIEEILPIWNRFFLAITLWVFFLSFGMIELSCEGRLMRMKKCVGHKKVSKYFSCFPLIDWILLDTKIASLPIWITNSSTLQLKS